MATTTKDSKAVLPSLDVLVVAIVIVLMVLFHWRMRNTSVLQAAAKMPAWLLGIVWSAMLILLILSQESSGSFIYFQF